MLRSLHDWNAAMNSPRKAVPAFPGTWLVGPPLIACGYLAFAIRNARQSMCPSPAIQFGFLLCLAVAALQISAIPLAVNCMLCVPAFRTIRHGLALFVGSAHLSLFVFAAWKLTGH
jgi:hypothetical protein